MKDSFTFGVDNLFMLYQPMAVKLKKKNPSWLVLYTDFANKAKSLLHKQGNTY